MAAAWRAVVHPEFLADVWSRRIKQEHRCVYLVQNQRVEFLQGRYHD